MQPTHIANPVRVIAAVILELSNAGAHDTVLRLSDGRNYTAGPEMTARHFPQAGDYLVTQEDGYEYLNPKNVFERNYSPIDALHPVEQIALATGGTIDSAGQLPDGSGFATLSLPLPDDHWLTQPGVNEPPAPFLKGASDKKRQALVDQVSAAARYAVRASTINGTEIDFDPDAMVQNMVIGMLGYFTPDGTSSTSDLTTVDAPQPPAGDQPVPQQDPEQPAQPEELPEPSQPAA
jgi:hypothetical protein